MNFDIGEYLIDRNVTKTGARGTCKVCKSSVVWGRDKVRSHKAANCEIELEEKTIGLI